MDNHQLKAILEALLMSSSEALSMQQLLSVFNEWENPGLERVQQALLELKQDYSERGIELAEVASGYCFQTRAKYGHWISRLNAEKPAKYSRALLETLAIIAYKQPVTRADIEDIRGVAVSSSMLKTLLEREWIRVAGHRDVPGKPAVYVTTKAFLDYFNLRSLDELPPLKIAEAIPAPTREESVEECVE
ncbi:SMC-Scp complex subunit ScpB [Legionella taurinensis]|uniref:SMC-Scp complex subunit ScpB n=1 Tax=Legionella taurinensis TaxID=70611 RepID=A0A3A5LDI9_9GAMM|nr:SMC-Scp complex subunit ScpB [Legionella taurinensis]MDX1838279.1 SMC-Scp complex subunit ScpB [Legionella taurinensis]PUT39231.1 SMC-Scp complex subunit ScpB [Legionella taurinensis]PUT40577.1 SMC-Scp complex subunit ScpB [Legionella taurinensis]PUT43997.1 SMC-Scp complex subunit ScpB [Legionella taurinensis]PUT46259.1 SMC-Scp complex subunit ScpB [Legionella taurinensis]